MGKIQLSLAISSILSDRITPFIDGTVDIDGINFAVTSIHPSEIFWRQLKFKEFDVSEMSMASLCIANSKGDDSWVGLPIFTGRKFFHTWSLVTAASGIDKPIDLKGKRVGVAEYQQTSALWSRGILQHEFGVYPEDIEWYMERSDEKSHGGATEFQPPSNINFNKIPPNESIGSMLLSGKLDASLNFLNEKNLVDKYGDDVTEDSRVRTLFPNPDQEGIRYYQKTGIFPINHCIAIKRSVYEKHPWIALNIFKAFQSVKEEANIRKLKMLEAYFELGLLSDDVREVIETDLFPYGIKSNQKELETIMQFLYEQKLTEKKLSLEDIFSANTLDL